jgi:hypothetical protein
MRFGPQNTDIDPRNGFAFILNTTSMANPLSCLLDHLVSARPALKNGRKRKAI